MKAMKLFVALLFFACCLASNVACQSSRSAEDIRSCMALRTKKLEQIFANKDYRSQEKRAEAKQILNEQLDDLNALGQIMRGQAEEFAKIEAEALAEAEKLDKKAKELREEMADPQERRHIISLRESFLEMAKTQGFMKQIAFQSANELQTTAEKLKESLK